MISLFIKFCQKHYICIFIALAYLVIDSALGFLHIDSFILTDHGKEHLFDVTKGYRKRRKFAAETILFNAIPDLA